jgi:hypothetical protein
MLSPIELRMAIREKNTLLSRQTKRIELLEEKISELRKRYYQLKYTGFTLPVNPLMKILAKSAYPEPGIHYIL